MKRMILRLSALTAVISLGTFAVVQAQRSAQSAAPAVANSEPAELVIDEQSVKPMPRPTELATSDDRYAQPPSAEPAATQATAVDPFAASQGTVSAYEPAAIDAGVPPMPEPEDQQTIPPADEAMRRFDSGPARQTTRRTDNIRPLGYEENSAASEPTLADSPAAPEPLQAPNEPTLAPPRPKSGRAAPQEVAPAAEEFPSEAIPPASSLGAAPREIAGATDRYGRNVAPAPRGREPALLPTDSLDEKQSLVPADADNFTPPGRNRPATGSEGAGRPGGKHLEGPQQPSLTLEKIAPAEMQVGKPAVVQLKIRNTGPVPAAHVEVHDQVPKGAQLLSTTPRAAESSAGEVVWKLGALKPGEETSVELELMPVAEGELGSVATVHFAAESSMRTLVTRPVLALEMRAPKEVLQGEEVTFAIKLTNTGSGAATGVMLREAVPEMLEHPAGPELEYEVGTLAPGQSRELDLTMRAMKAGRAQNILSAVADSNLRVDQQAEVEIIAPQLAVKMEGPARRYLDRQATYTVSVSNPGNATTKEISLLTHLPPGLKFVEANNAGQYEPRTRTVQWLLEELPPGETGSVTLVTVPVEVGDQLVRIEGTAQRGLAVQEEKTISVEGVAAIFFEVVDVADPIEVGKETSYEVRVVNQGTKAATNVQVVVLLPEELAPVGADGPARYTIDGQRVLFEGLSQLAPKADTTYRVKAQGRGPGDVRVRVQVITDDIRTPITKEESTRVYADE